MRLSIVIPTYRRNAMLAECLAALAPQIDRVGDTEAIVIDNDPDAGARSAMPDHAAMRHVHESRRGVVHARNRGVAEARGDHLIFLDDDEIPAAGWLDAFAAQADAGVGASFGRIVPRYDAKPPPALKPMLDSLFSREVGGATGADISAMWAYLGTGNSMFARELCFPSPDPFDPVFNARGGEDIWMIRGLMARGLKLVWNREALVEELVPADRMTPAFLEARKFNHGQLRVIFVRGKGGLAGSAKAAGWMAIGAAQALGHGLVYVATRLSGSSLSAPAAAKMSGGMGKLLWWRSPANHYHD